MISKQIKKMWKGGGSGQSLRYWARRYQGEGSDYISQWFARKRG